MNQQTNTAINSKDNIKMKNVLTPQVKFYQSNNKKKITQKTLKQVQIAFIRKGVMLTQIKMHQLM